MLSLFLFGFTMEQVFAPTNWWIELRKVYIGDAVVGDGSPVVSIDQTVKRNFVMHWDIQVRRIGQAVNTPYDNGGGAKLDLSNFTPFCHADGETYQYPGRKVKDILTLQDLMNGRNCPPFTEGAYYVEYLGQWVDIIATKSIVYDTPVFHVDAPAPPPQVIEKTTTVIQKPVTINPTTVIQKTLPVVRTIQTRTKTRTVTRCEPSLIPFRTCARRR